MRRRRHQMGPARATTAIALALVTAGLTGCFTTTADFANDAEAFIEENEDLRDTLRAEGRLDPTASFTTATCADPANQDEGTTFRCTATSTTGTLLEFEIMITGSNEYEVSVLGPTDGP